MTRTQKLLEILIAMLDYWEVDELLEELNALMADRPKLRSYEEKPWTPADEMPDRK